MDANLAQYLMGKFPQLQNMSVDPSMQPGGMSQMPQGLPPPSLSPDQMAPTSDDSDSSPAPKQNRMPASASPIAPVAPIDKDLGQLSDDELGRYGIRSPEEINALKQQRIQMGDDLVKQGNINNIAKGLARAKDEIATTGDRILNNNVPNSAKAIGDDLDDNLKIKQQRITALDDANKLGDTDYNRLKDVDDKRMKLQELRDVSKDRNAALAQKQQELNLYRKSMMDSRNDKFDSKEDRKDDDQVAKFSKSVNGLSASSRNALGRSSLTVSSARRVMALAGDDEKQYDKISPQQVYEIAKGYDNVVSGGSPTVSGTSHLIPSTALGSLANFGQWMSSNNLGANQGALVKQMVQGSKRESAVAQNLQKRMVDTMLPAYTNLRKRRGQDMDQIVNSINQAQSDDVPTILNQAGVPHFGGNQPQAPQGGGFNIDPAAIKAEMQRRQGNQ